MAKPAANKAPAIEYNYATGKGDEPVNTQNWLILHPEKNAYDFVNYRMAESARDPKATPELLAQQKTQFEYQAVIGGTYLNGAKEAAVQLGLDPNHLTPEMFAAHPELGAAGDKWAQLASDHLVGASNHWTEPLSNVLENETGRTAASGVVGGALGAIVGGLLGGWRAAIPAALFGAIAGLLFKKFFPDAFGKAVSFVNNALRGGHPEDVQKMLDQSGEEGKALSQQFVAQQQARNDVKTGDTAMAALAKERDVLNPPKPAAPVATGTSVPVVPETVPAGTDPRRASRQFVPPAEKPAVTSPIDTTTGAVPEASGTGAVDVTPEQRGGVQPPEKKMPPGWWSAAHGGPAGKAAPLGAAPIPSPKEPAATPAPAPEPEPEPAKPSNKVTEDTMLFDPDKVSLGIRPQK